MRFSRIQIPAFGPFTDFDLRLERATSDLHLLYGPNEAGKSSLLRALRALLFGIHPQTADNFLHDYSRLRILAELQAPDGACRVFQRRKGNKNTLLDENQSPLPESEIKAFLGDVDEAYFDCMFGLGAGQLRAGADDLLRGEGRLGEALFSASMGGTPVDRVIADLEADASEIYSGRAQRRIRTAVQERELLLAGMKDALVRPEAWEENEAALRAAAGKLDALRREECDLIDRRTWLERCGDALEMVGQLRETNARMETLPALPDGLPDDFAVRLRSAREERDSSRQEVARLRADLVRIGAERDSLSANPIPLDVSAEIEDIHANLGAWRSDRRTLPLKQGEAASLSEKVRDAWRDIGMSDDDSGRESLRVSRVQLAGAKEKADALAEAESSLADKIRRAHETDAKIARLQIAAASEIPAHLDELKNLLASASLLEPSAGTLTARTSAVEAARRELERLRADLPGAPMEFDRIHALAVPASSTIDSFAERLDLLSRRQSEIRDRLRETADSISATEEEMAAIRRAKELPAPEELEAARLHRSRGWRLVLQDWRGGGAEEIFVEGTDLADAFADAIDRADRIADRLRADAGEIARVSEKHSQVALRRRQLDSLNEEAAQISAETSRAKQLWSEAWLPAGISPSSPREMREWREIWTEFRRKWETWKSMAASLEAESLAIRQLADSLRSFLATEQTEFLQLVALARESAAEMDRSRIEISAAKTELASATSERKALDPAISECEARHARAAGDWNSLAATLGLPSQLSPSEGIRILEARREIFREQDCLDSLRREIETITEKIGHFERRVVEAAGLVGVRGEGIAALEKALWELLQNAIGDRARLDGLLRDESELTRRLASAESRFDEASSQFSLFLAGAGCAGEEDAEKFLAAFDTRRSLLSRSTDLRQRLAGLARGEDVASFVSKIEQEDADRLAGSIFDIADRLRALSAEIESAREKLRSFEIARDQFERAGDDAARLGQTAILGEERILSDARRLVHLRLAISLLRGRIDEFRKQNQGPFMQRAGHWFQHLTGGAFEGIVASFGAGDQPVVAGRRHGQPGSAVLVAEMSEGTRDQLYLALRLGGLDLHLASHTPMPLILDDLLVHFDDERAAHALRALHEMARGCQILLFTHHRHLLDLAETALPPGSFISHPIGSAPPQQPAPGSDAILSNC